MSDRFCCFRRAFFTGGKKTIRPTMMEVEYMYWIWTYIFKCLYIDKYIYIYTYIYIHNIAWRNFCFQLVHSKVITACSTRNQLLKLWGQATQWALSRVARVALWRGTLRRYQQNDDETQNKSFKTTETKWAGGKKPHEFQRTRMEHGESEDADGIGTAQKWDPRQRPANKEADQREA